MLPASTAMVYRGCAFNDAAAMSATVARLEAELAQAKATLKERLANDGVQLQQRSQVEAEVARLCLEVMSHCLTCSRLHCCCLP